MKNIFKNFIASIFIALCVICFAVPALAADTDANASDALGTDFGAQIGLSAQDPRIIAANIIRIALGFLGIIAVSLVLYAGFIWMTANGNEENIKKAKKILSGAIIGLIIILSAWAITSFLIGKITGVIDPRYNPDGPDPDPIPWSSGTRLNSKIYPQNGETDLPVNIVGRVNFNQVVATSSGSFVGKAAASSSPASESNVSFKVAFAETNTKFNFTPSSTCAEVASSTGIIVPTGYESQSCFMPDSIYKVEASSWRTPANVELNVNVPSQTKSEFRVGSEFDVAGPTITYIPEQVCAAGSFTLRAHIVDNFSVEKVIFYLDGNQAAEILPDSISKIFDAEADLASPSTEGKHTIKIEAYDMSGNHSELIKEIQVMKGHCCNDIKDGDEVDTDCGGSCLACDGGACHNETTSSCDDNLCSSGFCTTDKSSIALCTSAGYDMSGGKTDCCLCQRRPTIYSVSPSDNGIPNGAPGNFVTISGKNFGTVSKLFENVLSNVDFENDVVGTLPVSWTRGIQKHSVAGVSDQAAYSGKQSVLIHQDAGEIFPGVCGPDVCAKQGLYDNFPYKCVFTADKKCDFSSYQNNPSYDGLNKYIFNQGESLSDFNNRTMWAKLVYDISSLDFKLGEKYVLRFKYKGNVSVNTGVSAAYSVGSGSLSWARKNDQTCVSTSDKYCRDNPGRCICADNPNYCCLNAPVQTKPYQSFSFGSIPAGNYAEWKNYESIFTYTQAMADLMTREGKKKIEIGLSMGYNDTQKGANDLYVDDFMFAKLPSNGTVRFLGDESNKDDDKLAIFPSDLNPACNSSWQDNQVIVAVPEGAISGPIEVVAESGFNDLTNDSFGPKIENFQINNIVRPGICQADPGSGYPGDAVSIEGVNFFNKTTNALFGSASSYINAAKTTIKSALEADAVVPNMKASKVSIFAKNGSALSNYFYPFEVKYDPSSKPLIDSVSPDKGPKKQYVTISGSNFKDYDPAKSSVKFYREVDPQNKISANIEFPKECQDSWWQNNTIIVKVPDTSAIVPGAYKIIVTNQAGYTSDPKDFTVNTGEAGPGICRLMPNNGPVNTAVSIFGDNFNSGTANVEFYNNKIAEIKSKTAQKIETKVPAGASTGFVTVNNGDKISNGMPFEMGICSSNSDCVAGEECCASGTYWEGVCKTAGSCNAGAPVASCEFKFSFTTGEGVPICGILECKDGCDSNDPNKCAGCDAGENKCGTDGLCCATSCVSGNCSCSGNNCDNNGAGESCNTAAAVNTPVCSDNCAVGYECLSNNACGNCCCDINKSGTTQDTCKKKNSALFCSNNTDTSSGCYDRNKDDDKKFGVCCGCSSDSECGGESCGSDTCCRPRPEVTSVIPVNNAKDICINSLIEVNFNRKMNLMPGQAISSIQIIEESDDACSASTTDITDEFSASIAPLAKADDTGGAMAFIWNNAKKIFIYPILNLFSNKASAETANKKYCASDALIYSNINTSGYRVCKKGIANECALLTSSSKYYVKIDKSLEDMYKINLGDDYIWNFSTKASFGSEGKCKVSGASIAPESYLFNVDKNDLNEDDEDYASITFDTVRDSDKMFYASALSDDGQSLFPVGENFYWSWKIGDDKVAQIISASPLVQSETANKTLVRADEGVVDRSTKLNVFLKIAPSGTVDLASKPIIASSSSDIYVFMCKNPWPAISNITNVWKPWHDPIECKGGVSCADTNFELYYCKDSGDLPDLYDNGAIISTPDEDPFKEMFFFPGYN